MISIQTAVLVGICARDAVLSGYGSGIFLAANCGVPSPDPGMSVLPVVRWLASRIVLMTKPLVRDFTFGDYYTNADIMTLGGNSMDFLPSKNGRVVAGRFKEEMNPGLPQTLLVGVRPKVLASAKLFRIQTDFIPVFVQPSKPPKGSAKWRYEGRYRVANRTPDATEDAEAAKLAAQKWPQDRDIHLVLHLEPEGAISSDVLLKSEDWATTEGAFDPTSVVDARERVASSIVRRRGQPAFRQKLLQAYEGRCAISGCDCEDALEAAHIVGYKGHDTNHIQNGLLLRGDLHTLFDIGKIGIDPDSLTLIVATSIRGTAYGEWHGRPLRLPRNPADQPNRDALAMRLRGWELG